MTYEPMGLTETATPEQRELASLTNAMVEDYVASRFDACTSAAAKLDERYGESKLTRLYREACRQQFAEPSADFQGQIALKEK